MKKFGILLGPLNIERLILNKTQVKLLILNFANLNWPNNK